VSELTDELNATVSALEEATLILVDVSSRNFSAEAADLEQYQVQTEAALSLATRLWDAISSINDQVSFIASVFETACSAISYWKLLIV
jgi:hypothetical protein